MRLHLEDGVPFDVSDDVFARFALSAGDEFGPERWGQIVREQQTGEAKRLAINYLSYRPRSSQEVVRHLVRKHLPEAIAEESVARLRDLKMIDDGEFARMFVRDRLRRGGHGRALLRQQLLAKGISRAQTDQIVRVLTPEEDQQKAAAALIRMRLRRTAGRKEDPVRRRKRLYELLLRRGFSGDIARTTLHQLKV
jgi:regulatory protein